MTSSGGGEAGPLRPLGDGWSLARRLGVGFKHFVEGKGGNKIHAFLSTADQMYVVVLSRSTLLIVCFVSLGRLAVHVYFVLPFKFTSFCRSRLPRFAVHARSVSIYRLWKGRLEARKVAKRRPARGDVSITKIQTGLSRPSQHPCRQECKQDAADTDKAAGLNPRERQRSCPAGPRCCCSDRTGRYT